MAQLQVQTLSGMMLYTGENSEINAKILADRAYGKEDASIGKLTRLNSRDSSWSKYPSYIYVESDTNYRKIEEIVKETYSYTVSNYATELNGTLYIDNNGEFNEIYTYEYDLTYSFDNAKQYPCSDVVNFVNSLNESIYNKQKHYNTNIEVDQIIFEGIKYKWYPLTDVLRDAYTGYEYPVGGTFWAYTTANAEAWSVEVGKKTATYTYTYTYSDVITEIDEETGDIKVSYKEGTYTYTYNYEETYWQYVTDFDENNNEYHVSYTTFTITNLWPIEEKIQASLNKNMDNFLHEYDIYDKEELYAYYISKADTVLKMKLNTYSLDTQSIELLVNYDGEFNNWFDNALHLTIDKTKLNATNDIATITASDDYYFGARMNTYVDIVGNKFVEKDKSVKLSLKNNILIDTTDTIKLLSPYKMKAIDLSAIKTALTSYIDLCVDYDKDINYKKVENTTWHDNRGCSLEQIYIGDDSETKSQVTDLYGINHIETLEVLDIRNCINIQNSDDISTLKHLHVFDAAGTIITSFAPHEDVELYKVSLPNTLHSLELKNVTFKPGKITKYGLTDTEVEYEGKLLYTPSEKLVSLNFDNVKGLNTEEFVKSWVKEIKTKGLLYSGLVNYVNLTNIEWASTTVQLLIDLTYLGLDKLTGKVNVIGTGKNGALTRDEYCALKSLYGEDVLKGKNDNLKFTFVLDEGVYSATLSIPIITTESGYDSEGEQITTTKVKYTDVTLSLIDCETSNIILDMMLLKDISLTNFKNSAFCYTIEDDLLFDETYSTTSISAGDIVLYNGNKLLFFIKDYKNLIYNYVKVGSIKPTDVEKLNKIFEESPNTLADIKDNSIIYVDKITLSQYKITDIVPTDDYGDPIETGRYEYAYFTATAEPTNANNTELEFIYDSNILTSVNIAYNTIEFMYPVEYTTHTYITVKSTDNTQKSAVCYIDVNIEE